MEAEIYNNSGNNSINKINLNSQNPNIPQKPKNNELLLPLIMIGILIVTAIVLIPVILTRNNNSKKIKYIPNKNSTKKINKYIDLHLHLDGAITVDIAKKLAKLQNYQLPTEDDEELEKLLSVPEDCKSLNDFLKCFELPVSLLQTKEGLSEAVKLVADNIQSQGVI